MNITESSNETSFAAGLIKDTHITGKLNLADVFAKEMKEHQHLSHLPNVHMVLKNE